MHPAAHALLLALLLVQALAAAPARPAAAAARQQAERVAPVMLAGARPFDLRPVAYERCPESHAVAAAAAAAGPGATGKLLVPAGARQGDALVAEGQYVVRAADGATEQQLQGLASDVLLGGGAAQLLGTGGGGAWRGLLVQLPARRRLAERLLRQLLASDAVALVEPSLVYSLPARSAAEPAGRAGDTGPPGAAPDDADGGGGAGARRRLLGRRPPPPSPATQDKLPSWGLGRIDGRNDDKYEYTSTGAGKVCVYVLDTGAIKSFRDLGTRRLTGAYIPYTTDKPGQTEEDYNGHGTHVAGIVAGGKYGVAKRAFVVPVRVAENSGQTSTANIISGIAWVLQHSSASCSKKIINLSLSGPASASLTDAVNSAVGANVLVVTAAGNNNTDACEWSPANAAAAITVAATSQPAFFRAYDPRMVFSNYGPCVDLFAPGNNITSAGLLGEPIARSGTSMAAPHVSGLAARLWGSLACANATSCRDALLGMAENNTVMNAGPGTVNRFAAVPRTL